MDFDLVVAACATMEEFADTLADRCLYVLNCEGEVDADEGGPLYPELVLHILQEVRNRSLRYLSFRCFMSGISSAGAAAPPPSSSSSSSPVPTAQAPLLTLLNQGPETAEAYRTLLARYVGVP